jgi:hypothetical protein
VCNRAWYCGYVCGFEMFRSLMLDDEQHANFKKVHINDVLVDTSTINELTAMGKEELPDVPNLDSK